MVTRRLVLWLSVVALWLGLAAAGVVSAQDQPEAAAGTANGWIASSLVQIGSEGFSSLGDAAVGDGGRVVVYGTRNGQDGLFVIEGSTVISAAVKGMALPAPFGTLMFINDREFGVDAAGDVWFTGQGSGEEVREDSAFSVFRWRNGVITRVLAANGHVHVLTTLTNDGKWLSQRLTADPAGRKIEVFLNDGVSSRQLLTFIEENTLSTANCRISALVGGALNENDVMVYNAQIIQRTVAPSICDLPEINTSNVEMVGAITQTVASAVLTRNTERSGAFIGEFALNDDNTVVYHKQSVSGSDVRTTQLIQKDTSGEVVRMEAQFTISTQTGLVINHDFFLDNGNRITFQSFEDGSRNVIYAGGNLASDRVIGMGETLFGQTLEDLDLLDVSVPASPSVDNRAILFAYTLADSTEGIAIASRGVTRWVNPAGGEWGTAANWLPADVPGAGAQTLFDLDAGYDVTVGSRQSGSTTVQDGSVGFRGADLELIGPLLIGGDALLTVPEGTLEVGGLIVGALPLVDPLQPTTAKLTLSNQGTVITSTGETRIGNAGDGELFVSGASLSSAAVEIGAGSVGTATVGTATGQWTTGNLSVGSGYTGTLNIERGAVMRTQGEAVIGGGGTPQNFAAAVIIDSGGGAQPLLANWIVQEVTIGDSLFGNLALLNGGTALMERVQMGTQAHAQSGKMDAGIIIEGTISGKKEPSRLEITEDLFMGMAPGAKTDLLVRRGGDMSVQGNFSMAHEQGSAAAAVLSGERVNEAFATLVVGKATNIPSGDCLIGRAGQATLRVEAGSLLVCNAGLQIGVLAGGQGTVIVTGSAEEFGSTIYAFFLCVGHEGSTGFCDTEAGARGLLRILDDGIVSVERALLVGSGGIVAGNGTLINEANSLGLLVDNGGILDPGINLEDESTARTLQAIQPGTLTITGNVTISPTAQVRVDVLGKTNFDRVVVNGNVQLGGTLTLNFGNGYAPKQGDTFAFVQASTSTGSFANVEVNGLADGFQFEVQSSGGGTQLVAKNDGIPTTQPAAQEIYLPRVTR